MRETKKIGRNLTEVHHKIKQYRTNLGRQQGKYIHTEMKANESRCERTKDKTTRKGKKDRWWLVGRRRRAPPQQGEEPPSVEVVTGPQWRTNVNVLTDCVVCHINLYWKMLYISISLCYTAVCTTCIILLISHSPLSCCWYNVYNNIHWTKT